MDLSKMNLFKKYEHLSKMEKELLIISILSISVGGVLLLINFLYIKNLGVKTIYDMVTVLSASVIFIPPVIVYYSGYTTAKAIEERFPDFLRDVVEGLRGGMTLPLAIKYASRNKYGALSPYIDKLVAQISWGIPFEKALRSFSDISKSKVISRSVSTIIESHRSGGDIATVLDSVGEVTVEIDKMRREREARIYTQMMTGYIIFFVFVGVMIGMEKFLLPALKWGALTPTAVGAEEVRTTLDVEAYGVMFTHLAIIQGVFSGLAIGKLAEGRISAGLKHSVILALIGFAALSLV